MTNTETAAPVHPRIAMRAQALEEVGRMQQDLMVLHDEKTALERELQTAQDRVSLLIEERNRWRHDAVVYRDKLVELATSMANINLMTIKATEIMQAVKELVKEVPAAESEEASKAAIRKALEGETV